ncbi:MAG: NTPase [Desulfurococcales archaeon]|nr:NTPase [Desulfurococcales archaeon]
MKVLITGRPGIGKTTVFMRVVKELRRRGLDVAGFTCPEVRVGGRREGFDIIDIESGVRVPLARVREFCESGIRVGKYCVEESSASEVGTKALEKALAEADVIAVDEVGPMELAIPVLKERILEVLRSRKPVLAVVHRKFAKRVSSSIGNSILHVVTMQNRAYLHRRILEELGVH